MMERQNNKKALKSFLKVSRAFYMIFLLCSLPIFILYFWYGELGITKGDVDLILSIKTLLETPPLMMIQAVEGDSLNPESRIEFSFPFTANCEEFYQLRYDNGITGDSGQCRLSDDLNSDQCDVLNQASVTHEKFEPYSMHLEQVFFLENQFHILSEGATNCPESIPKNCGASVCVLENLPCPIDHLKVYPIDPPINASNIQINSTHALAWSETNSSSLNFIIRLNLTFGTPCLNMFQANGIIQKEYPCYWEPIIPVSCDEAHSFFSEIDRFSFLEIASGNSSSSLAEMLREFPDLKNNSNPYLRLQQLTNLAPKTKTTAKTWLKVTIEDAQDVAFERGTFYIIIQSFKLAFVCIIIYFIEALSIKTASFLSLIGTIITIIDGLILFFAYSALKGFALTNLLKSLALIVTGTEYEPLMLEMRQKELLTSIIEICFPWVRTGLSIALTIFLFKSKNLVVKRHKKVQSALVPGNQN